jgi:hypothetical protein
MWGTLDNCRTMPQNGAMANTKTYSERTPVDLMLRKRRAWKTGNGYQVFARSGGHAYQLRIDGEGLPVCSCPAAEHGLRCWHQQIVARRLLREMEAGS